MYAQIFIFIYTFKWYIVKLKTKSIVSARLVENQNLCFTGVNIKTPVLTIMVKDVNFNASIC
jgi:hypothetical protein